jgi:ribosome-associated protein
MPEPRQAPPAKINVSTGLPDRPAEHGHSRTSDAAQEAKSKQFCIDAARVLADDKCEDVLVLDLRGKSQITDFFVIASGSSDRQIKTAAEHVSDLAKASGMTVFRSNLDEARPNWIVLDLVDVVLHTMLPEARLFYDIEMLWGDAPRVEWERPGESPLASRARRDMTAVTERNRAGLRADDVLPRGNRVGE